LVQQTGDSLSKQLSGSELSPKNLMKQMMIYETGEEDFAKAVLQIKKKPFSPLNVSLNLADVRQIQGPSKVVNVEK
jgi:hypothetical protein